jgi:hypothetical protein
MTFASPVFLAALALLVPVLVVFLVRRQRRIVVVPSTMIWRASAKSRAKSRAFRNLRRLIALAACLGAVGLLALAASRPGGRREESVVFVVDVSASMAGKPIEEAKALLFREMALLGPKGHIAIVTAGERARIVLPLSQPGPVVEAAIRSLRAEREVSATSDALALAESLGARIVLVSDQAIAGREDITQKIFGQPHRDNLGITTLFTRAAPDAADEGDREATIAIGTSSPQKRSARLVVTLGARVLADRVIDVESGPPTVVRIGVRGAGRLVARVSPADRRGDALAIDDEASLDEKPRTAPRVALYGADGHAATTFFVERALKAAGVTSIVRTAPWDPTDVAVVLTDGSERPRGQPALYVGVEPDLGFATRVVYKGESRLRSIATEEPLMKGVVLDEVTILHSKVAVSPPSTVRSLIELDGGPAMVRGGVGRDAFLWLGIDPEGSDLVLRVAFPVLVANALAELSGAASVVSAETTPPSEVQLPSSSPAKGGGASFVWKLVPSPAVLLAMLAAGLLVFEAWLSRDRRSVA